MKYILRIIQVNENNFTCRIESMAHHVSDNAGMATVAPSRKFFPSREASLSDALERLRKFGVKDEDIIVQ